jgi:hypothetical protein
MSCYNCGNKKCEFGKGCRHQNEHRVPNCHGQCRSSCTGVQARVDPCSFQHGTRFSQTRACVVNHCTNQVRELASGRFGNYCTHHECSRQGCRNCVTVGGDQYCPTHRFTYPHSFACQQPFFL